MDHQGFVSHDCDQPRKQLFVVSCVRPLRDQLLGGTLKCVVGVGGSGAVTARDLQQRRAVPLKELIDFKVGVWPCGDRSSLPIETRIPD